MALKFFETLNQAFVAHFARRFADLVNEQGSGLLDKLNLITPATSVSTVLFLHSTNETTITELADALGFTHQMATQRINNLVKLKLVRRVKHPNDQRSRALKLSKLGESEAEILVAFTQEVSRAFEKLNTEINTDLSATLQKAEKLLRKKPLSKRINLNKKFFSKLKP